MEVRVLNRVCSTKARLQPPNGLALNVSSYDFDQLTHFAYQKGRLITMATSDRFVGKVAVITGGTTGISRAIATRFVKDGGKIVIGARHDDLLRK